MLKKYVSAALVLCMCTGSMPWGAPALAEAEIPAAEIEISAAEETAVPVEATAAPAEEKTIVSFDLSQLVVDNIVPYSTPEAELGLPAVLTAHYSDSSTGEVAILWTCTEDGLGADAYDPLHDQPQQAVFRFKAKLAEAAACSASMPVAYVRFDPMTYIDVGYRLEEGVLYITAGVSLQDVLEAEGITAEEIASIVIEENGCLTDGTYAGEITNHFLLRGGSYSGRILNYGIIEGGEFAAESSVENYGSLEGGHYAGTVSNSNVEEAGMGFIFGAEFDQPVQSAGESFELDFTRHYCLYGNTLYFALPDAPEYAIDYAGESISFTPCLTWDESSLQRLVQGDEWTELAQKLSLADLSLPGSAASSLFVRQLCGENASESLEIIIPPRPVIENAEELLVVAGVSETDVEYNCEPGYEVRILNALGEVCNNGSLTAGTEYVLQLRMQATDSGFASDWTDGPHFTTLHSMDLNCGIDYVAEEFVIELPAPAESVFSCSVTAPTWSHVMLDIVGGLDADGYLRMPIKKIITGTQSVRIDLRYRDANGNSAVCTLKMELPGRKNYLGMGVAVDPARLAPQSLSVLWATEELAAKDEIAICVHGAGTSRLVPVKGDTFTNLQPDTGYDVYVRNRASSKVFASNWWKSIDNVKTLVLPSPSPSPSPTPAPTNTGGGGGGGGWYPTVTPTAQSGGDVREIPTFELSEDELEFAGDIGARLYRDYLGSGYGIDELYLMWDSEELQGRIQMSDPTINFINCQPQGYQLLPIFRGDGEENYHSLLVSAAYGEEEGAQPRTLRMSLLQLKRMYEYMDICELIYRNGPAEISFTLDELLMGDIAKLCALMLQSDEPIDLLDVDFAVIDEIEILDEQLAQIYIEMHIDPMPLADGRDAWTFSLWLCKGEVRVDISVLLYSLLIGMDTTDVAAEVDSWDVGLVDMEGETIPMDGELLAQPEVMPEGLDDASELFTAVPVVMEGVDPGTMDYSFEAKADLAPFRRDVLTTVHAGFGSYVLFKPDEYFY